MRLKSSIFFKLFSLMVIGFLIVFAIQFIGRTFFFDRLYISNIHTRNTQSISKAADRINNGEELYYVLYDENITDINAYITDNEFDIIEHGLNIALEEYIEENGLFDEESYLESIGLDTFQQQGNVFYQIIDSESGNEQFTIYFVELEDNTYLVFEHYLYGLFNANDVLNSIDLYIVLGMIVFLVPYTYWYSRRFSTPLKKMNIQVNALSNLEFPEPLEVTSQDELGQLTESINKVSKNLETSINKLYEDIEFEKFKDKKRRELIASLSHELKTPITTLRAVIEGMRDNIGKYSNRDIYLQESLDYLLYMENLSKNLIDAINIESKTIKSNKQDLLSIYSQSLRFVNQSLQAKEQTLVNNMENINVFCNKEMITRVFINLITNASKYSPVGEDIVLSTRVLKDCVEISILNKGAYINPGDITHLFEPFYRVEKSRNKDTGGSGLGLFIIKTILDGHQSNYKIENVVEGVLFTFTLKMT